MRVMHRILTRPAATDVRWRRSAATAQTPIGARPAQARAWRAAAIAALIATGVLGAQVLREEWISGHLEAATAQDLGEPAPLPWDAGDVSQLCSNACPPRADAALGVHLALTASREPDPDQRHKLLVEAQGRLTAALKVRPSQAGWWAWLAYARSLDGRDPHEVFDALAQSYAAAPFLSQEGLWRTTMCAANWTSLSPALRRQVVDEAVWMRDVDPQNAAMAFAAFQDPAALAALNAGLNRPPALLVPHRRSGNPGGVGAAT